MGPTRALDPQGCTERGWRGETEDRLSAEHLLYYAMGTTLSVLQVVEFNLCGNTSSLQRKKPRLREAKQRV